MSTYVYMFPGQASQYPGMGKDLYDNFAEARETFQQADDALGFPISKYCFEGSESDLVKTEITQPAILTVSIAAYRILCRELGSPLAAAGHSLGEYSALVACGAIPFEQAVVIVHHRGTYMQEAVPEGAGAMAAIMGLERDRLNEICTEAAQGEIVSPANFNAPSQVVISGHRTAVERATVLCKDQGAKRSVLLPVSAPFHCALMKPAAEKLAPELDQLTLNQLSFPVLKNVDAHPYQSRDEIARALALQVTHPVLWQDCAENLAKTGAEYAVEVGPGRVLAGLMKRIDRTVTMVSVETSETARTAIDTLLH